MKKGKNTRCPVKNWATWSANAYFFLPFGFLFLPPLLKPRNHEIAPIFIQFFFSLSLQVPEKHPPPRSLPQIWFQFGAARQFGGCGWFRGTQLMLRNKWEEDKTCPAIPARLTFLSSGLTWANLFSKSKCVCFFFSPNLSFLKSRRSTSCCLFFSFSFTRTQT